MSIFLLILIVLVILLIILYLSKIAKIKEAQRRDQEGMKQEAGEKIMRPEIKLHEEEKRRWEDEYWKRQERREDK